MTAGELRLKADELNPSQHAIISVARDNPLTVWAGAIRSGKGVGTARWLIRQAMRASAIHGRHLNHIVAGTTVASFLSNNEDYIRDIAEAAGLEFTYTTKRGRQRIILSYDDVEFAQLHVLGGGTARSHFSLRGLTAHSAWIDEATLVHEDFTRTVIQRCSFDDSRVVLTTNAGVPTHYIKRDYMDTGAAALLETDFMENRHYSDTRREEMLKLNPHTSDYARSIRNQWTADEGAIIPILPEHLDHASYPASHLLTGDVVMDPGTAGITAALLFVPTKYGHLVADEYYYDGQRQPRLDDRTHIVNIARKWRIRRLLIDPAAAGMKQAASALGFMPINANNRFEAGVQSANNALYAGMVKIRPNCRNLIAESGGYVWNPAQRAPVPTAPDHLMDCLRYGIIDLYPTHWSMII